MPVAEKKVSIAVTGTAVPLSATSKNAAWVQVQSASTNNVAGQNLGDKNVTGPGGGGANPGVVMSPGGSQLLPGWGPPGAYDLGQIFVNGTSGDVFYVLYNY